MNTILVIAYLVGILSMPQCIVADKQEVGVMNYAPHIRRYSVQVSNRCSSGTCKTHICGMLYIAYVWHDMV